MTDTLIAISVASEGDKLVRLSGFTSTPVGLPVDISTVVGFLYPQQQLNGCNWNKDGDACFCGGGPGGVAYKLDGLSTTKKNEISFASLTSNGITNNEDNPIVNSGDVLYEFLGWSSTPVTVRSIVLDIIGIEWDGNDLLAAWNNNALFGGSSTQARIRRYVGFSSTLNFEVDTYNAPTNERLANGISYDGLDTIFSGEYNNKLYKRVAFSSTAKGADVDVSAFGGKVHDLSHMSYAERTSQKTPVGSLGTYWSGDKDQAGAGGSLYHQVGFTSTLDGTVRLAATDTPADLTYDGTNIYWCGKKNTNEPILRKCSGFSSTPIGLDIPTSGLGDTDPQGMSWDGVNMLWAGAGASDKLYRQLGFTSTPSASAACPGGHHEPKGVSWVGTHTLWYSAQSAKIIRSPGFTSTATETLTPPIDPTLVRGVSFTGTDVIWADYATSGQEALVKQDGFSTTIKNIVYVGAIDNAPSGIDHGAILERIGPGFAVVIRPRAGRRKLRRRFRPAIRFGRKTFSGTAPAAGPRPLQSLIARRVRKPRNRKTRQPVLFNRPMHTSVAPAPSPPQLGDILWLEGDGATYTTIGVDIGTTAVLRSSFDITGITVGEFGLSWDGRDAYFTAAVRGGGVADPRIYRTLGWSSTIQSTIFLPLGSDPRGVCWDGRDTLWADGQTRAHYKQSGFTSTPLDVKALEGATADMRGLTWTGGDCIWIGYNNGTGEGRIYRRSGFNGPTIDSVSPLHLGGTIEASANDVTWDGSNLITSGTMEVGDFGGVSRRVGWSSTHDVTIHVGGAGSGCCVADVRYRLGGANPVRRMVIVPRSKRRTFRPVSRLSRPQIHVNPPAPPTAFSPATLRRPFRRAKKRFRPRRVVRIGAPLIDIRRHYFTGRGKYRVFNTAAYIFYRSSTGPPTENDALYQSSATLPATPATTFADGTWWISVAYFNGVIKSGFLPLGPNGETFVRLDIAGGAVVGSPPQAPGDWRLELRAGGVVRVVGFYLQLGANRATDWAITYTTNGSTPGTPPAVSPTVTVLMSTAGLAVLSYDLPAQANGTTVKVRVQTKRGTAYSENSVVKTAIADAAGPSAPVVGQRWPGRLPENL